MSADTDAHETVIKLIERARSSGGLATPWRVTWTPVTGSPSLS